MSASSDSPARLRLDRLLVRKGIVATRSQAESWIRLGKVTVSGKTVTKPGTLVARDAALELSAAEHYVSRAGLKLASIADRFKLDFSNKTVLDVGSSTGGFTDFAVQHGAQKVIAVDVGTNQLHPTLRSNPDIELHEQTDIRNVQLDDSAKTSAVVLARIPDIVVIDVSFISLREILPHIAGLVTPQTQVVAMLKPQFESGRDLKHKGVIKNDAMRRRILSDFEGWAKQHFVVLNKADSDVAGAHGNRERFYLLQKIKIS